jgi:predicted heme/steroid binding protein
MADCFKYIAENGKQHFDAPESYENWRDVVHPAIHSA